MTGIREEQQGDAGRAPFVLVFLLSWLLWMLLAGRLDPVEMITGALAALLVALVSGRHVVVYAGVRYTPGAILHLFMFLLVFARALLYANLDMARRVLSPSLPIRPAVVEVETGLRSDLGRLLLTTAITLTPGTLSIDVEDNRIRVHWIDCPPGMDLHDRTSAIVCRFEKHLSGFLL